MNKAKYFPLEANTDQAAKLADTIGELTAKQRQVEAELYAARAKMRELVMPQFFEVAHGSSKPPQGVVIPGQESAGLRMCVPKSICHVNAGAMPPFAAECFREHQTLSAMIKTPEKGKLAPLKANVEALLSGHGEARWASRLLPVAGFHTQRHGLFSPEQNLAIDLAAPLHVRVLV